MKRFHGTLTSWQDDRGFGFIEPASRGDPIFVHISAFNGRGRRPAVGQVLSFVVEIGPRGRKRAISVEAARVEHLAAKKTRRVDTRPLLAIAAFLVIFVLLASTGRIEPWVAGFYGSTSLVCACAYLIDKSAAEHARRRTSESTLLVLGLIGGWPGAIAAQQLLRHKTGKPSFQRSFWVSVVANVSAFVAMHGAQADPTRWLRG